MTYEKMKAEVIVFDNSDVITTSAQCASKQTSKVSCGHQTSGNSCNNNGVKKFDNCLNLNHTACGELGTNEDGGSIM